MVSWFYVLQSFGLFGLWFGLKSEGYHADISLDIGHFGVSD